MDLLKKFWPLGFKAKKGDVVSLIVWLVIGIIFCALVGWVIGLVASLPIINIFVKGWLLVQKPASFADQWDKC